MKYTHIFATFFTIILTFIITSSQKNYPGREKKRILQDNHEKCKSCKILAEKANLAIV